MSERRAVLYFAMDVDRDKYTYMSVAAASIIAALHQRAPVSVTYESPISRRIKARRAFQHASSIRATVKGAPPENTDILLGAYVWNDGLVRALLPTLRDMGVRNRIILGGPQVTAAPKDTLETTYPEADVFIRGDGEDALAKVVQTMERVTARGVLYAGDDDDCDVAYADLSQLPSPYLDTTMPIPFTRLRHRRVRWETKRGCIFKCKYCQHRRPDNEVHCYPWDRLVEEMKLFVDSDVETLTVVDPLFNYGDSCMRVIGELRRLGFRGKLAAQCRFECTRDEFVEEVRHLDASLEFGIQTIHREEGKAIGRPNKLDCVADTIRKLHDAGIHFEVDLMYGLPLQTVSSFKQSIDFCKEHRVPKIRAWPLMLLRGIELDSKDVRHTYALREGNDPRVVISSSTFDEADWREMDAMARELGAGAD